MPSIKDMAHIVDVAPESISRTIASLKKDNVLANRKRFTAQLNISHLQPMAA
jgi:DNA-binding transcriptional regulator YhcF (GntR family)